MKVKGKESKMNKSKKKRGKKVENKQKKKTGRQSPDGLGLCG